MRKKGSILVEKLLMTCFVLAAGVSTGALIVDRLEQANGEQTVELEDNTTFGKEDIECYEQYGVWPGTYVIIGIDSGAGFEGIKKTTIILENDGKLTYQVESTHPIWGGTSVTTGIIEKRDNNYFTFAGGGPGFSFPDCAYEYGGCN